MPKNLQPLETNHIRDRGNVIVQPLLRLPTWSLTAARIIEVELLPSTGSFHANSLANVCSASKSSTASLNIRNKSEPIGIDLIQKTD